MVRVPSSRSRRRASDRAVTAFSHGTSVHPTERPMASRAVFQPCPVRTAPTVVAMATIAVMAHTRAPRLRCSAIHFLVLVHDMVIGLAILAAGCQHLISCNRVHNPTTRATALPPRLGRLRRWSRTCCRRGRCRREECHARPRRRPRSRPPRLRFQPQRMAQQHGALRMVAIGIGDPLPAMSGALPWMGSYRPRVPSPSDADGSRPMEPASTEASSVRMSPNMFSVTITSKSRGRRTRYIAQRIDQMMFAVDVGEFLRRPRLRSHATGAKSKARWPCPPRSASCAGRAPARSAANHTPDLVAGIEAKIAGAVGVAFLFAK